MNDTEAQWKRVNWAIDAYGIACMRATVNAVAGTPDPGNEKIMAETLLALRDAITTLAQASQE